MMEPELYARLERMEAALRALQAQGMRPEPPAKTPAAANPGAGGTASYSSSPALAPRRADHVAAGRSYSKGTSSA